MKEMKQNLAKLLRDLSRKAFMLTKDYQKKLNFCDKREKQIVR